MTKSKFYKNGFTIVELIVASAISITVVSVGFFILEIALKGNKIDEAQRGLNARLNDTLDFILDEVKVGRRIIDNELDITSLNSNCRYPESSEFLFGISLPDQALVKSDYTSVGEQFILNKIECPIVYSIRPSNTNEVMPYSLIRYGPQYNEKGFYISPSFQNFQETVLLEGIASTQKYEKIVCPQGWNNTTVKGITFCIDTFKKSIEIQIETEASYLAKSNSKINSLASTGGFNLIQDETQVSVSSMDLRSNADSPICIGVSCCWIGVCLKSNKITYMIDSSYFMNENYDQHPNGLIVNGQWTPISDPNYISPEINGKSLISTAVSSLKQHIYKLPTSNSVSNSQKVYIQIIAFNNSSNLLFDNGPRELTIDNKIAALSFLDSLSAQDETIEPWDEICSALESDSVEQIILISASIPSRIEGNCAGSTGNYTEIINDYNKNTRSKSPLGTLIIDAVSLFHNFCETTKNYDENNWLGLLSSGEESVCTHIK